MADTPLGGLVSMANSMFISAKNAEATFLQNTNRMLLDAESKLPFSAPRAALPFGELGNAMVNVPGPLGGSFALPVPQMATKQLARGVGAESAAGFPFAATPAEAGVQHARFRGGY